MIADALPLQPEFVPGDVRHRDGEIDALTSGLQPITVGRKTEPILLYGPSGTGKTCIARYAVDELRREVVDLDTQYVNCWEDYTRFKALYRVLEGVDGALNVHRQSTPRDELLDRVRNTSDDPYVVVLDEVDQLEDKKLLYDLHRTKNVSLVLVANREQELFSEMGERLISRLHTSTRIQFDRYGTDEIIGILQDRVRWGLSEDCIDHDQLTRIAEAAAGDARIAIGILRAAAREASERGVRKIGDSLVEEAIPEAKAEIRQKHVQKLTEHQRVLFDIIVERDGVSPSDLYDAYADRVADPKTRRMMRNHLQKMKRYNLVRSEGKTRNRTYHPRRE